MRWLSGAQGMLGWVGAQTRSQFLELDRFVAPQLRRRAEEIGRELSRFVEGQPSALGWFVHELARLLGTEACTAFRLS